MVRFPTTRKYLEIPVLGAFRGHSGPFRGQSPPSVRSRPEGPKRTEFPAAPTHAARQCGSVDALTSRAASTNRNLTAGRTEAPARTRPWRRTRASAAKAPASRERSRGQLRPPPADAEPPYEVRWHPEADAERDASWPPGEKVAMFHSVEKLEAVGPRLGHPHSSAVQARRAGACASYVRVPGGAASAPSIVRSRRTRSSSSRSARRRGLTRPASTRPSAERRSASRSSRLTKPDDVMCR